MVHFWQCKDQIEILLQMQNNGNNDLYKFWSQISKNSGWWKSINDACTNKFIGFELAIKSNKIVNDISLSYKDVSYVIIKHLSIINHIIHKPCAISRTITTLHLIVFNKLLNHNNFTSQQIYELLYNVYANIQASDVQMNHMGRALYEVVQSFLVVIGHISMDSKILKQMTSNHKFNNEISQLKLLLQVQHCIHNGIADKDWKLFGDIYDLNSKGRGLIKKVLKLEKLDWNKSDSPLNSFEKDTKKELELLYASILNYCNNYDNKQKLLNVQKNICDKLIQEIQTQITEPTVLGLISQLQNLFNADCNISFTWCISLASNMLKDFQSLKTKCLTMINIVEFLNNDNAIFHMEHDGIDFIIDSIQTGIRNELYGQNYNNSSSLPSAKGALPFGDEMFQITQQILLAGFGKIMIGLAIAGDKQHEFEEYHNVKFDNCRETSIDVINNIFKNINDTQIGQFSKIKLHCILKYLKSIYNLNRICNITQCTRFNYAYFILSNLSIDGNLIETMNQSKLSQMAEFLASSMTNNKDNEFNELNSVEYWQKTLAIYKNANSIAQQNSKMESKRNIDRRDKFIGDIIAFLNRCNSYGEYISLKEKILFGDNSLQVDSRKVAFAKAMNEIVPKHGLSELLEEEIKDQNDNNIHPLGDSRIQQPVHKKCVKIPKSASAKFLLSLIEIIKSSNYKNDDIVENMNYSTFMGLLVTNCSPLFTKFNGIMATDEFTSLATWIALCQEIIDTIEDKLGFWVVQMIYALSIRWPQIIQQLQGENEMTS